MCSGGSKCLPYKALALDHCTLSFMIELPAAIGAAHFEEVDHGLIRASSPIQSAA